MSCSGFMRWVWPREFGVSRWRRPSAPQRSGAARWLAGPFRMLHVVDEGIFEKCVFEKCIFEKCIFRKFCKFLAGSFSAVSKRIFATKYAFDSIFQALISSTRFAYFIIFANFVPKFKLQNLPILCLSSRPQLGWSDLEIAGNHEEVVALQARPAREGQLRVHLPGQLVGFETFDVHGPGLFV